MSVSLLCLYRTVQHGCGPDNNVECDIVLQYACEDSMPYLRDGYPTGDPIDRGDDGYKKAEFVSAEQDQDGTRQIPM